MVKCTLDVVWSRGVGGERKKKNENNILRSSIFTDCKTQWRFDAEQVIERSKLRHIVFLSGLVATRLALSSVLGQFESTFAEIHSTLWNFRLEFVTHITTHKRPTYLSYDCDLWIHLVFRLLLAGILWACRSFSRSERWLNRLLSLL